MITVKQVITKKDKREFVKLPFKLYEGNPYWVPPLIKEEMAVFDARKNPTLERSEYQLYLAYRKGDSSPVGRIAVMINWDEVEILNKKQVRFGWFEAIDDINVTKALIDQAVVLAKKYQFYKIEGPMGFSNLDKVGCLTEGFDKLGTITTWYTPEYYLKHFEAIGFQTGKQYIESEFSMLDVDPAPYIKASRLIKKRYGLRIKNFTSSDQIMPFVDQMFELFNSSYSKLDSFVPISKSQIDFFKKKYIGFINPEYIKFVFNRSNKMVAFVIVMPSFASAMIKAKGKLFPFGFYHLLKAKKESKDVVFYLIGIDKDYQKKGVTAIIFEEYYRVFKSKSIKKCIRTPELSDNYAMHNLWKNFNPKIVKKRKTFVLNI